MLRAYFAYYYHSVCVRRLIQLVLHRKNSRSKINSPSQAEWGVWIGMPISLSPSTYLYLYLSLYVVLDSTLNTYLSNVAPPSKPYRIPETSGRNTEPSLFDSMFDIIYYTPPYDNPCLVSIANTTTDRTRHDDQTILFFPAVVWGSSGYADLVITYIHIPFR